MRCDDFQHHLDVVLDSRRNPFADSTIRKHVADCESCRRWLDDWSHVELRLDTDRLRAAKARVEAAATPSSIISERTRRSGRPYLSAIACAIAIAIVASVSWKSQPSPTTGSLPAHSELVVRDATLPVAPSPAQTSPTQALELDDLRGTVAEPRWWGSVMVAAIKPVDPLTESIRPLADTLQLAIELLTPRAGLPNSAEAFPPLDDAALHHAFSSPYVA